MNVHLLAVKTAVSSLSTNSILSSQGVYYTFTPSPQTSLVVGTWCCTAVLLQGQGGTGCTCIHAIRCSKHDLRCQHYACYQWKPSIIMGWCSLSPTVYSHVWENGYTYKRKWIGQEMHLDSNGYIASFVVGNSILWLYNLSAWVESTAKMIAQTWSRTRLNTFPGEHTPKFPQPNILAMLWLCFGCVLTPSDRLLTPCDWFWLGINPMWHVLTWINFMWLVLTPCNRFWLSNNLHW